MVVVTMILCSNMIVSVVQTEVTIQKSGICIIILIPVDGNICKGLEQVRRAAIEKSGS